MTTIKIVCPKCESQFPYEITSSSESFHKFRCSDCHQIFVSRIVRVRAKRSRGSKKENKRHFSVRFYDFSGNEGLIEFDNASSEDFELRARDIAVFTYVKEKLRIVQNCTINYYLKVSSPRCFLATYVYGPASEELAILRGFRDKILLSSMFFSPTVELYYHVSPIAVTWLRDNRLFKDVLLILLKPVVSFAKWYLQRDQRNRSEGSTS
ncbi:MAG: hypothetical protein HXS46_04330 [Theionarchaea archaeon]|nr:hypothetical protein [Theionarchaea archaeon]